MHQVRKYIQRRRIFAKSSLRLLSNSSRVTLVWASGGISLFQNTSVDRASRIFWPSLSWTVSRFGGIKGILYLRISYTVSCQVFCSPLIISRSTCSSTKATILDSWTPLLWFHFHWRNGRLISYLKNGRLAWRPGSSLRKCTCYSLPRSFFESLRRTRLCLYFYHRSLKKLLHHMIHKSLLVSIGSGNSLSC